MGPQTANHVIWEFDDLQTERDALKRRIIKAGGNWTLSKFDLANKYTKWFQMFLNAINFDNL
jgi:hypothetical protein